MTKAETILWSVLRRKQLRGIRFRRQHPIGRYIVDFYCFDCDLVIEVDGSSHIGKEQYDAIRSEFLRDHGMVILRFTNEEVMGDLNWVLNRIRSTVNGIRNARKSEEGQ